MEEETTKLITCKTSNDIHNGYVLIRQSLDQLSNMYPRNCRSVNHEYSANNWLKTHGKPMRRKPFKSKFMMLDEFQNVSLRYIK